MAALPGKQNASLCDKKCHMPIGFLFRACRAMSGITSSIPRRQFFNWLNIKRKKQIFPELCGLARYLHIPKEGETFQANNWTVWPQNNT
jgi:hypothetical protein